MKFNLIFLYIALLLMTGCGDQFVKPTTADTTASESSTSPVPDSPRIFDTFEEFSPILEYKNDTTYVVNFWATWCKPCVEEMPYIEKLNDVYKHEKLKVILVSLDFPQQITTKLLPYIEENQLQSEVVVLTDGRYNTWIDKVDAAWGGAIPATLIYRNEERIFVNGAVHNFEELQKKVETILH